MKTVKGANKAVDKNKGMPAKPMIPKGMGKGVKKPMKSTSKYMGY